MIAKHFYETVNVFDFVGLFFILPYVISLLHWSSFSGPFGGPGYQNQEHEKHFEHFTANMSKARNESAFPQDEIDSHREHFYVS